MLYILDMAKKKKRGRPPKAKTERQTNRLMLTMTEDQREHYEQAAELNGQSLSEWIRSVCDRAAKRQTRDNKPGV
jgi:uncharacterized protein (DUF1778 family)